MTKMAVVPIYGKIIIIIKKSLCPVTVLVDSQVSDRCPMATCSDISIEVHGIRIVCLIMRHHI